MATCLFEDPRVRRCKCVRLLHVRPNSVPERFQLPSSVLLVGGIKRVFLDRLDDHPVLEFTPPKHERVVDEWAARDNVF